MSSVQLTKHNGKCLLNSPSDHLLTFWLVEKGHILYNKGKTWWKLRQNWGKNGTKFGRNWYGIAKNWDRIRINIRVKNGKIGIKLNSGNRTKSDQNQTEMSRMDQIASLTFAETFQSNFRADDFKILWKSKVNTKIFCGVCNCVKLRGKASVISPRLFCVLVTCCENDKPRKLKAGSECA